MRRKKQRRNAAASTQIASAKPAARLLPIGAMLLGMTLMQDGMAADAGAKETTLSTVEVKDQPDVEVQDGYQATKTRVGKVLQDPHDIPQAVTTVTSKLMEEQQVGSLREALRNVSGLTFNAAEGGRSGDNMMLRGFYTFGDTYLDGIRDTAQYNRETFNLEQVDVLRGSAAMLFGRGQAGGVINQVSKVPLRKDQYKLTGSLGTEGYQEITGDFNKRLGDSTAMRVNVMKRDEGSWRENPTTGTEPELHRDGIAASIATGLRTDDEFVLSHVYTRTRDLPDYGFSFDGTTHRPNTNFPVKYFWGFGGNFDDSDTSITTGTWTHEFSPTSQLRTSLRYADYERSYWARTPSATCAPGSNGLNANGVPGSCIGGGNPGTNAGPTRSMDYETLTLQSDYNTQFRALGMKHELVAGVEYLHENSHRTGLQNLGVATAPNYQPYVESTTGTPVNFKGDSYAVYAQDTFEFMPFWKATLGVRRDELDADYSSTTSPSLQYGEWSYRAALSWQPSEAQHYYLSWSDSFSPTADLYQLTVTPLPPERSKVYELGSKWLLMDGDLALRAAVYRAEKEWERNTDLESTAAVLTKKRRTDGIELEAAGRITENWEIFAGLALMDAEILEVAYNNDGNDAGTDPDIADPRFKGQRARNTPPYTFNLWTTYKLGGGWKIGGGVEAKGDRYGYVPSSQPGAGVDALFSSGVFRPNTAPANERWDAMVAYEQKSWVVRLNIRNLLDKVWYDAIYDNGAFTIPGMRRSFILTGELKF